MTFAPLASGAAPCWAAGCSAFCRHFLYFCPDIVALIYFEFCIHYARCDVAVNKKRNEYNEEKHHWDKEPGFVKMEMKYAIETEREKDTKPAVLHTTVQGLPTPL